MSKDFKVKNGLQVTTNITASGDISGSGTTTLNALTLKGLSTQGSETTAVMINGSNVVGTRDLGSNAFTSTTIGTTTNALTVDNATLQLNTGTTFNGSAARTISVKDGGIDSDALADNISLTNLTASANISGSGTLSINHISASGGIIADKIVHVLNLDRQTLESMGTEARKHVLKKFEIEKMCFSTYTEYKKLFKKIN